MATNVDYEVPAWNQIYDMLLCQAQKIKGKYKPAILVGIARGGVIPARILTDLLDIPQFVAIQIEFYTDITKTTQRPILKQPLNTSVTDKTVLLVDDIADSGQSLKLAIQYLQEQGAGQVKTATLYYKPKSVTMPDFYEKQTEKWVVFPWDVKETLRKIMTRQLGKRAVNQEVAKLVKAGLPKQLAEKLLADTQRNQTCYST